MKPEFERIEAKDLKTGDQFKYLLSQRKVFTVSEVKFLDAEHDNREPVGRNVLVSLGDCKHLAFMATEIVLKAKATTTVPTAVKELKFDYSKICEVYAKTRKLDKGVIIFHNLKGEYLKISKEDKTIFFINYNRQKLHRFFAHNMPILTFEQFEADLVRMKIPVPERNAEYQSTNNQ